MSFSEFDSAVRSMRFGVSGASKPPRKAPRPPGSITLAEIAARAAQERFNEVVEIARAYGSCDVEFTGTQLPEVKALLEGTGEPSISPQGVIFTASAEKKRETEKVKKSRGNGLKPNRVRQTLNESGFTGLRNGVYYKNGQPRPRPKRGKK